MRLIHLAYLALAIAVLCGTPAARAWTIDSQSGNKSDGTARFSDPDQELDQLTDPAAGAKSGIPTVPRVSFGLRPADSRYSRTYPFGSTRVNPPSALHGDDSHLFWGNSRYR